MTCADPEAMLNVHQRPIMTAALQHPSAHGPDVTEAFSPEPDKRKIELAFVHRLNTAVAAAAADVLGSSRKEQTISSELAAVRSPVFAAMARQLEKSVPDDADFGAFHAS